MSSTGVSLDSAIADLSRGVESARKAALQTSVKDPPGVDSASDKSASDDAPDTSDDRVGTNIDVKA